MNEKENWWNVGRVRQERGSGGKDINNVFMCDIQKIKIKFKKLRYFEDNIFTTSVPSD